MRDLERDLEPLGPQHNERDYEAWGSSIDHIRSTPGLADWDWPTPMSLEQNLGDLEGHARDFRKRTGFTYSILDADEVIGCGADRSIQLSSAPPSRGGSGCRSQDDHVDGLGPTTDRQ